VGMKLEKCNDVVMQTQSGAVFASQTQSGAVDSMTAAVCDMSKYMIGLH